MATMQNSEIGLVVVFIFGVQAESDVVLDGTLWQTMDYYGTSSPPRRTPCGLFHFFLSKFQLSHSIPFPSLLWLDALWWD